MIRFPFSVYISFAFMIAFPILLERSKLANDTPHKEPFDQQGQGDSQNTQDYHHVQGFVFFFIITDISRSFVTFMHVIVNVLEVIGILDKLGTAALVTAV